MSFKNPMNFSLLPPPSFLPNAGELSRLMILAGINSSPKHLLFHLGLIPETVWKHALLYEAKRRSRGEMSRTLFFQDYHPGGLEYCKVQPVTQKLFLTQTRVS